MTRRMSALGVSLIGAIFAGVLSAGPSGFAATPVIQPGSSLAFGNSFCTMATSRTATKRSESSTRWA